MDIILEQSWEDASAAASAPQEIQKISSTNVSKTKVSDIKKTTDKTKTVTGNNTDKSQLTVDQKKLVNQVKPFHKLFLHSVSFLKKFGPLSTQSDLDEESMLTILKTYTVTSPELNNTKLTLIYIDWILRLTTPGSFSNKYMIKNQKQYNYIFSKNGDSSITIDLLLSIPKNKTLKGINYIFNPKTIIGSGLEMSTPSTSNDNFSRLVSSVRNGVYPTIRYSNDLQTSTFDAGRSPEEWHSLVMQFYKNNVYGQPKTQFQTKF